MVGKKTIIINDKEVPIRSYEVSIWSLQDSFITVLKWADVDNRGQIQNPELILDIDGTETFKFSVPMYLKIGEENPIWYNTANGNLMIGMRKIKVILNKRTEEEAVFEFIITKVTERHEANELYCDVECEGLAFHELGKIGYKINFSADTFINDYEQWFNNKQGDSEPRQTIDYWNKKTDFLLPYDENNIIPGKWYYKVEMSWDGYNSEGEQASNKVYENEYVSSWELNTNNILIPKNVVRAREKERPVEISDSNIYNITQKIAEAFGVFCRYEYGHDDNYHIISRTIIYYNNFIEEKSGHMDLTYPYHTSQITREMDSTELVTKLFVREADYQYTDSGKLSIMDVEANKSREDYILNFDYLHKFNIISDEQYEAIATYEAELYEVNNKLINIEPKRLIIQDKITEYEAKLTTAKNGVIEAAEQKRMADDHLKSLPLEENGFINIGTLAPKAVLKLKDETDNSTYVKMPFNGVVPSSVQLYDGVMDYTKDDPLVNATKITGVMEFDPETNELIKITHLSQPDNNDSTTSSNSLWLTCKYNPTTYWTKISAMWEQRQQDIEQKKLEYEPLLESLKTSLDTLNNSYNELIEQQHQLRKDFEEMMGPALREGYWQPEDYQDYGDKNFIEKESYGTKFKEGIVSYDLYNEQAYDDNTKVTYQSGDDTLTYLCIELKQDAFSFLNENYEDLYFIYYDVQGIRQAEGLLDTDPQKQWYERAARRLIHLGGNCRIGFIKKFNDGSTIPALIIEQSKLMSDEQITFFKENKEENYESKISLITFDSDNGFDISEEQEPIIVKSTDYVTENIQEVYPRFIINSLNLKANEDGVRIKFNDTVLEQYKDYSIYVESDADDSTVQQAEENERHYKYIIDIKPLTYVKVGSLSPKITLQYELSNASTLIYLDALEVAKENAEPKVSYTIELSIYDPLIIHTIYNKLSKIVHINDVQLKFENVQGYISHINMFLDTPWDDKIEIKNYKTKFEDLFSNIVAQTDSMQKKSYGYDVAALAFGEDGNLTSEAVTKMLDANAPLFNTYIDEHLIDNVVIKNTLTSIFNEAGSILNSAGNALADMRAITSTNASILSDFAKSAEEGFGRGIDLVSSVDGQYTSAVQINNRGIFIGSDQQISLYSGVIGDSSGTSIDLNPERLILGVSSDSNGTAAKFTEKYLVLAAGDIIAANEASTNNEDKVNVGVTGTINGLTGAKFTKDSIGFATYDGSAINAILMNDKGITLGSGTVDPVGTENRKIGIDLNSDTQALRDNNNTVTGASYVRISGAGIDIGSGGELYVNTNNFVVNSNPEENTDNIFELKKKADDWTEENKHYDTALRYNIVEGLTIIGNLSANSLVIEDEATQKQSLSKWVNAKVTPERIWFGVKRATAQPAEGESSSADRQTSYLSITDNDISILSGGGFNIKSGGNLNIESSGNLNIESGGNLSIESSGNLNIESGGNLSIESGGNFNVASNNLIIDSAAVNTDSIFELKKKADDWTEQNNHYDTALKYSITGGLIIAGNLNADTGTIGGWNIGDSSLYSGIGNSYVALDSGTSNEDYALWAGSESSKGDNTQNIDPAPFRVKRDGSVYLNKLMVLDSRPINGNSWGLGGNDNDHFDKYDGVDDEGNEVKYGYKAIDFSKLNFKQAVSATGSWSGTTFNVKVSLWGVLSKTVNFNASFGPSQNHASVISVGREGNDTRASLQVRLNLGGSQVDSETIQFEIDAGAVYNAGWNDCRKAMLDSGRTLNYYTGDKTTVTDSEGYTMQVLFPYVSHSITRYDVPAQR